MTGGPEMSPPPGAVLGAVTLLDRSIAYLLGSLSLATPAQLDRPTPCADWDLRTLLAHTRDGLTALAEAARVQAVGPSPAPPVQDPIAGVRDTARDTLARWAAVGVGGVVTIGSRPLSAALVAAAGAIEITAHGWDIARATGWHRPVPESLADEMLDLLPLLLPASSHQCRYAAAVPIPDGSCLGDRLIAFLGRRPPGPVERRYLQARAGLLLAAAGR